VHRSISWFKSRPGLQPSLLRSFGSASQPGTKAAPELKERRRPSLLRSFGSASQPGAKARRATQESAEIAG